MLRASERFAMCDVIAHKDLNEATRADMVSYTGCIADVLSEAEFPRRALGRGQADRHRDPRDPRIHD